MEQSRKMWRTPWGYPESAALTGGIVSAGLVLQAAFGSFDFCLLASPVNLLLGGAIVLLCIAAAWLREGRFVKWLSGVPMAVCLVCALLLLSLIMGLTPQGATPVGGMARVFARLGFNDMTSSWAFGMIYFMIMLSLGSLVARRIAAFRWKDWSFHMNHAGLWLVLFASGLGHADMERYTMQIDEGEAEWRARNEAGHMRELPVAIRLNDFDMEFYPSSMRPEPKRFVSDIEVFNPDGTGKKGLLEVNHPLRMGNWTIYQYGYDAAAGSLSTYSVVMLVRDPWLWPVYAGFMMVATGAIAMIWNGRKQKKGAER